MSLKKLLYFIFRLYSSNCSLLCVTHCSRGLVWFGFCFLGLSHFICHHPFDQPVSFFFPHSRFSPYHRGFPGFTCTCILSHSCCPNKPNFLLPETSSLYSSQLLCCPSCSSSPCTRSSDGTCNTSCICLNISTLKGVQENMCLIFIFVCSLQKYFICI